jgi:hypothetical protein
MILTTTLTRKSNNSRRSMKRRSKKRSLNSLMRITNLKTLTSMKDTLKVNLRENGKLRKMISLKMKRPKLNLSSQSSTLRISGDLTLKKTIQEEDLNIKNGKESREEITEEIGKWTVKRNGNQEEETTEEENGEDLMRKSKDPDTTGEKE